MKIIDNALGGIEFGDLGVGATFKYGEEYFIKIPLISCQTSYHNAVNLEEGTTHCFNADESVIPFNCELIVL